MKESSGAHETSQGQLETSKCLEPEYAAQQSLSVKDTIRSSSRGNQSQHFLGNDQLSPSKMTPSRKEVVMVNQDSSPLSPFKKGRY